MDHLIRRTSLSRSFSIEDGVPRLVLERKLELLREGEWPNNKASKFAQEREGRPFEGFDIYLITR